MSTSAAEMLAAARAQIDSVSPGDAMAESTAGPVIFLDVREPVEWEHHITGAMQVPRGLLEFAADPASPSHKEGLEPGGRVIVYCRSGSRAALATATLEALGYQNVVNLDGGFNAWKEAGLPVSEHHESY